MSTDDLTVAIPYEVGQVGDAAARWTAANRHTIKDMRVCEPRVIDMADYLLLIHRCAPGRVRQVPAAAIEGERLSCPCGEHPAVGPTIAKCAGCERYYLTVDETPFVVYGDMTPPGGAP